MADVVSGPAGLFLCTKAEGCVHLPVENQAIDPRTHPSRGCLMRLHACFGLRSTMWGFKACTIPILPVHPPAGSAGATAPRQQTHEKSVLRTRLTAGYPDACTAGRLTQRRKSIFVRISGSRGTRVTGVTPLGPGPTPRPALARDGSSPESLLGGYSQIGLVWKGLGLSRHFKAFP